MSYDNPYVELAHGYLKAAEALDADALSKLITPDAKAQFLPSAPLGPLGEPTDKDGFLAVVNHLKKVMKDGRMPAEILEITDASSAGLVIAHTKTKDAFTVAGQPYVNEYIIMLWMSEVEGELKITRIQDFFDSTGTTVETIYITLRASIGPWK
ncbi:hypothetical protein EXIGLDRAFT_700480 [Exidia glandulosa HHB12029]|uniref:SnoaL-like domain-containing protein n=1 Tax=Exidia glandulosa HHB12029 TaxID=1314781 RepID=A0A165DEW0_EXIGL|nr:hypothetical protein EXIGLDRAFT_700480 [Exidia glandulosa HHB12029]